MAFIDPRTGLIGQPVVGQLGPAGGITMPGYPTGYPSPQPPLGGGLGPPPPPPPPPGGGGAPPPPNPPGGPGGGPGVPPPPPPPGGGHGRHDTNNPHYRAIVGHAINELRNGLMAKGIDPQVALRFAKGILSHRGVTIGPKYVEWQGKKYKPAAMADSRLAELVRGLVADRENQRTIEGDAGYQQAMAELGLQRDINTAAYDDQQRRAVLDYGSGAFTNDPTLGAQADANQFSISRLLQRQTQQNQQAIHQNANLAGTLFGGGLQSGIKEEGFQNAGRVTDATRSLQDLISSLNTQRAQTGSAYQIGQQGALTDATNRLIASGAYSPVQAPTFKPGDYRVRGRKKPLSI